jgi:hypothetical protein
MFGLFKQKPDPRPAVTLHLAARLQPVHRGEVFEDPLDAWLREHGLGDICGGGSEFLPEHGVLSCDIELRLNDAGEAALAKLAERVRSLGAPAGSKLIVHASGREIAAGANQGLAVHLNGAELPDSVYESCSLEDAIEVLSAALAHRGKFMSFHHGERETSLYFYGASYADMREALAPAVASYPLCHGARLERIA